MAPARYARATLAFGNSQEPYIREYIIGPMAKGNQTRAVPLTFLSTRNSDKKLRVYDSDIDAEELTSNIVSQAAEITQALWNMVCHAHKFFINFGSTLTTAIRT